MGLHRSRYSKLFGCALCTLLLCQSLGVYGAVQKGWISPGSLHQEIDSSFHLLGYCPSIHSPECTSLLSLLAASEALTRRLVKARLVEFDATYWQTHLNASTATHLWFACHDGQQIEFTAIDNPDQAAAAALDLMHSCPARAARASAAAVCSPGVPFYACLQLPNVFKLDLLMSSLAAAVHKQGGACIAGQLRNMHPAAAAAAETTGMLASTEAAALEPTAPEAKPKTVTDAFLQALGLHHHQLVIQKQQQLLRDQQAHKQFVWGVARVCAGVAALCLGVFLIIEPQDKFEIIKGVRIFCAFVGSLSAAVVSTMFVTMLLDSLGWAGDLGLKCAMGFSIVACVGSIALYACIGELLKEKRAKASATATKGPSPATTSVGVKQVGAQKVLPQSLAPAPIQGWKQQPPGVKGQQRSANTSELPVNAQELLVQEVKAQQTITVPVQGCAKVAAAGGCSRATALTHLSTGVAATAAPSATAPAAVHDHSALSSVDHDGSAVGAVVAYANNSDDGEDADSSNSDGWQHVEVQEQHESITEVQKT